MQVGQEILAAFLFGRPVSDSMLLEDTKRLGFYHVLVFSAFHVVYWRLSLRRWLGCVFRKLSPLYLEIVLWLLLFLMHFSFDQGWAARRAMFSQFLLFLVGSWGGTMLASLCLQIGVITGLLLWEPSALHSMPVWMSILGSLTLASLGTGLIRHATHPFWFSSALTLWMWLLAQGFGVSFLLLPALCLGYFYTFLAEKWFGVCVLLFLASFLHPRAAGWLDQIFLKWLTFQHTLLQGYLWLSSIF